jgi:molybdopterin synthase sulfur carrier subunit
MKVEVRRYATLAQPANGRLPGEPESVELPEGATIADLLRRLGLAAGDVHLAIVDGRIRHSREEALQDGARVALFPPVGGG